jgi:hypothetical protein
MKAIFWIGPSGFFGSLIRLFKHRGISHCEILFTDGFSGTSDSAKGGIALYPLAINTADWFVIDIPCSLAEEAKVRQFFVDEAGCGYDWVGIVFCQVFHWTWRSETKWFCSEACLAALQPLFPELKNIRPFEVDPATLAVLLEMTYAQRTHSVG